MLQDHQLDEDVKKALAVTFCVNTAINKGVNDKGVNEIVDGNKKNEENEEIIDIKEFSNKFSGTDNPFSTFLQQIISVPIEDKKGEIDETEKLLKELFKKIYKDNEVVKEIIDTKVRSLWKLPTTLTKKGIVLLMGDLKIGKNGQLYVKNRMYIPENKAL